MNNTQRVKDFPAASGHSDTILLGATFFSAAYSAASQDDCLIIERKGVIGGDFADCMNAALCPKRGLSPLASELRDGLTRRKLLDEEGRVYIVPFAAVLTGFMWERKLRTLLETDIISVTKRGELFEVRVFNRDGFGVYTAKRVIDTRPVLVPGAFRTLALVLLGGETDLTGLSDDRYFIQRGINKKEFILHLRLTDGDSLLSAKEKLSALISSGDPALVGWRAAACASTLAYHYPDGPVVREENGVTRAVSASYGDPLAAFEGGYDHAVHTL